MKDFAPYFTTLNSLGDVTIEIRMTQTEYHFYESNCLVYDCSNKENLFTKMCMIADHYNNNLHKGVYFAVG